MARAKVKTKVKRKNTLLIKLGLALLTIILVAAIIFIAYYFTKNKEDNRYINQLYNYKEQVDKSNAQVGSAVDGLKNINVKDSAALDSIRKIISGEITNLENVLLDISSVKPIIKYRSEYDNLINGIHSNKDIFTQANLILKNTKSTRIKSAVGDLSGFITTTTRYYEASKLKKAYIILPDSIKALPDKINSFAMDSYRYYQNRSHNNELYTSYFSSMDKVINAFNNDKIDLGINIDQINAGTLSIDDVYIKIENKLSEISEVQSTYDALSPPPKMGDRHKAFDDLIKTYSYYCQDFKTALSSYEEALTNTSELGSAKSAFDDLKSKYTTLSIDFTNYYNGYIDDKAKYSDINNQ